MEQLSGIKKPKYRIIWKSFRTPKFHKSPFVFEKIRAEYIVLQMEGLEIAEEKALRRKKNIRTKFFILKVLEYIPEEVDDPERVYGVEDYKNRLALLRLKGLI